MEFKVNSIKTKTFNSPTNPLSVDAPDLTNFSTVEEWLNSIKMARYLENFNFGGIVDMDAVVNLTVEELTGLGITLVVHQNKIMNSVQNIRAQIDPTNPLSVDAPDSTNFSSVEEWLNSIKMARYLENFNFGGIVDMDAVVNLTVEQLTDLGITLVGHQQKIMNSIQNILAQIRS